MKRIDLTGRKFGRWTVLADTTPERRPKGFLKRRYQGVTQWRCQCECGKIKEHVLYTSLTSGCSQSCGCLRSELHRKPDNEVHALRNPLYSIWMSMKTRCYNERHVTYPNYGGRGIGICDRWLESFDNFAKDMGPRPSDNHSVERKDNNGDYSPENCCWHTHLGQSNNRRNNLVHQWKGKRMNLTQIARMEDVDYSTLYSRVRLGSMDLQAAMDQVKKSGSKFMERAEALGGSKHARRTNQKRPRKPRQILLTP